jgi:hypothetical protein
MVESGHIATIFIIFNVLGGHMFLIQLGIQEAWHMNAYGLGTLSSTPLVVPDVFVQ